MSPRKTILELDTWPRWINNHLWWSWRRRRCHRLLLLFLELLFVVLHMQFLIETLLVLVLEFLREALAELELLLEIDFASNPLTNAFGRALRDTLCDLPRNSLGNAL